LRWRSIASANDVRLKTPWICCVAVMTKSFIEELLAKFDGRAEVLETMRAGHEQGNAYQHD
jgi:hypothetical protein